MTLDANKAMDRRLFEVVFPAGDPSAVRDLVAPEIIDHDPMPGQPASVAGIEHVVSVLHTAHTDLRFSGSGRDPMDAARHQYRPDVRTAASGEPVEHFGHCDLSNRGRQDRGALGPASELTGLRPGPTGVSWSGWGRAGPRRP